MAASFTEEEGTTRPSPVVILSDGLWQRRFAADPSAVGRSVILDGRAHTIVGVMPRDFAFPLGGVEAWIPLVFDADRRADRSQLSLTTLGRLRDGTTLDAGASGGGRPRATPRGGPPRTNAGRRFALVPLREEQAGFTAPFAAAFQGSAVFVLLIACLNVGAVLAARAVGRRRELALKAALGAGRWRIARQLLAESVMLSLLGGLLALGIAAAGIDFIRRSVPEDITRWIAGWSAIQLDVRVMAFALAAVVLTALASGLSPVLLAGRLSLEASLREGGRGTTPGPPASAEPPRRRGNGDGAGPARGGGADDRGVRAIDGDLPGAPPRARAGHRGPLAGIPLRGPGSGGRVLGARSRGRALRARGRGGGRGHAGSPATSVPCPRARWR